MRLSQPSRAGPRHRLESIDLSIPPLMPPAAFGKHFHSCGKLQRKPRNVSFSRRAWRIRRHTSGKPLRTPAKSRWPCWGQTRFAGSESFPWLRRCSSNLDSSEYSGPWNSGLALQGRRPRRLRMLARSRNMREGNQVALNVLRLETRGAFQASCPEFPRSQRPHWAVFRCWPCVYPRFQFFHMSHRYDHVC